MTLVIVAAFLLLIATTVLHYEVLGGLNAALPQLRIPNRAKLLVVMFAAFFVHAIEITLYGLVFYAISRWLDAGAISSGGGSLLASCMFFSAETFTALGFVDITPAGAVRLLVGVEGLNGLLLIGWSASFTYLAMERFWNAGIQSRQLPAADLP
ncbi:MAG TPA: ion channel [Candidatus Acidoferrum sp.]|nr:ion channel [Candidatus Acidoferrum sp.]